MRQFSGIHFRRDNSIVTTNFTGFSITTLENLFIRVKNAETGELITCTIVVIQGGEIAGEYTSNPLNIAVENPADLTIVAKADYFIQQQQVILHPGFGVNKTVEFELQESYAIILN